ncbi:MAG TPA: hypothetical protein VIK65_00940 [Candidatus Limnocylindrales bacterium]|jgi:TolB protein
MEPPADQSPDAASRVRASPPGSTTTGGTGGGPVLVPVDGRPPAWRTFAILVVAVLLIVAAVWIVPNLAGARSGEPATTAAPSAVALASNAQPSPTPATSPAASAALSPGPAVPGPSVSLPAGRTLPAGSIAVVQADGSLSLVDAKGHTLVLSPPGDATHAFPAWSPDGSRLAAIRYDAGGTSIVVYDAKGLAAGDTSPPLVIFRSSKIGPFYASWTPDGRKVSFLADEADLLSLRVAPADGSAPLDGSGPGARIRTGNPFYFDWIGNDRLLAHVGTGAEAFLGEIGLDGAAAGPQLKAPGDFRSAVANHDASLISYVRAGQSGGSSVVVSRRDGTREQTMPVFGTAGMTFQPSGDMVASIGPVAAGGQPFSIPIGPLRVLDPATGKVRTLLDGSVVSFWWSPDAKTIAALRVQPVEGGTGGSGASASTEPTRSPAASSSPAASAAASVTPNGSGAPSPSQPPSEVRLLFLDVASGRIESQSVVEPGQLFIDQFLTYFDQYALSHQLWAPDSSALLLPVAEPDGTTHISVISRNGDPPLSLNGAIAFWSP